MKIYCPSCFYPNESGIDICEKCRSKIEWQDQSYEDKLIKALSHKDYSIVLRAAQILSNFKSDKTKAALTSVILSSNDPYIQEAAVSSLANIYNEEVPQVIKKIALSGFLSARLKAIETMGQKSSIKDLYLLEKLKHDNSSSIKAKAKEAIKKLKERHQLK